MVKSERLRFVNSQNLVLDARLDIPDGPEVDLWAVFAHCFTCIKHFDKALLILHAPEDQTVSIENAAAIFKAAQHPKSFISLSGADHLLSHQQDARYAADMIAVWAKRYMHGKGTRV